MVIVMAINIVIYDSYDNNVPNKIIIEIICHLATKKPNEAKTKKLLIIRYLQERSSIDLIVSAAVFDTFYQGN